MTGDFAVSADRDRNRPSAAASPSQKTCESCGGTFSLRRRSGVACWCDAVKLGAGCARRTARHVSRLPLSALPVRRRVMSKLHAVKRPAKKEVRAVPLGPKPGRWRNITTGSGACPLHDDRQLFEFLILEGAQAGLSWETILKKRENYRRALRFL